LPAAVIWSIFVVITTYWEVDLLKRVNITAAVVLVMTVLTLWGAHASADQTLYRWTDERGNPVNSDRPPPAGVDYEVISTSSSMVRQVDADEGAVPLKVKPTPSNDFEPENTEKPASTKNPEYCAIAQENLKQLDTSARIRLRNEQGEIRYLNEEEKAVERQKALSGIETFCEEPT
jgi:hypothetical protein